MKILIVSDIHGKRHRLASVLDTHPDAAYLLFLGDGIADVQAVLENYPRITPVLVRGNCDPSFRYDKVPLEMTVNIEGVQIFMHHGHTTGVKHGLGCAAARAVSENADVCLFGHTHEAIELYENGEGEASPFCADKPLYLFNPGSLGQPSHGNPRYGIMHITRTGILFSHGEVAFS